ncbi:hypothetical protein [uncultured Oscillibacter sp.]|uniref:hypothetical protein n=1 Tax=uncultured Oscillibacter sp. TaxID=876091 RepID=UPI0025D7F511|nr:hypothetical protein [uncultured Oscillibacter sp.]
MNEVKSPKKPLIYYYGMVLLILVLFNFLAMPWFARRRILEVDYGAFMDMTARHEIGRVEIQDNFTDRTGTQIYKTGRMVDPGLVYRLKDSGAVFSSEIIEQMSPVLSFLLSWVLPIAVLLVLGNSCQRK